MVPSLRQYFENPANTREYLEELVRRKVVGWMLDRLLGTDWSDAEFARRLYEIPNKSREISRRIVEKNYRCMSIGEGVPSEPIEQYADMLRPDWWKDYWGVGGDLKSGDPIS
jgi:hypothetical protein